jgi:hypothetical protein
MVEKGSASAADLRAQARRCRSLASGLLPGEDRRRLNEIAASLEAEAGGVVSGDALPRGGGRQMAEA